MRQDQDLPIDPLSLSGLFAQYLDNRIQSGSGLDLGSEVVLHDAGPVQPIDPRLAWDEAITALQMGEPKADLPSPSNVPDWRGLVASQEPALDLAFCAGNFPQMVRNLNLLLADRIDSPRTRPFLSDSLAAWTERTARKTSPQTLLAAGLLRLAQDFDRASRLLTECTSLSEGWHAARQNEEAALAWHQGRRQEASAIWGKCGDDHVPSLFNRGMSRLFLGKPAEAVTPLRQAITALPESGSWHHLARLYLTLAEMRR